MPVETTAVANVMADAASGSNTAATAIVITLFVVAGILVWMIPVIIAFARDIPNRWSVAAIDGFLGWTLVAWAVALAMALSGVPRSRSQQYQQQQPYDPGL